MPITKYSIKLVLSVAYLVGILVPVVILTLVISNIQNNYIKEDILADSLRLAERLAKDSRIALIHHAKENVVSSVNMVLDFPNIKQIIIFNKDGKLLIGEYPMDISFEVIRNQDYSTKKAIILKETSDIAFIVAPVFISSTSSVFDIVTNNDQLIDDQLGYVLILSSKAKLKAITKEIWRDSLFITIMISILIYLSLLTVLGKITTPIKNLANFMTHPNTAKEYKSTEIVGVKEVREISMAFNRLMQDLKKTNEQLIHVNTKLEHRVEERTADLQKARDVALNLNAENRTLISGMNKMLEDERKYVARELHDQLNSTLVAIKLKLKMTKTAWKTLESSSDINNKELDTNINDGLESVSKMISDVYESSRNIVRMLRPEIIDSLGLVGAVEDLISNYRASSQDCNYKFHKNGNFSELEYDLTITIYRIIQESLSNIAKHAEAKNVEVKLLKNSNGIYVSIQDNGIGFNKDEVNITSSIGLLSMRERVFSLNGEFIVESDLGKGTRIVSMIPYSEI